jgi:hypothetical protein
MTKAPDNLCIKSWACVRLSGTRRADGRGANPYKPDRRHLTDLSKSKAPDCSEVRPYRRVGYIGPRYHQFYFVTTTAAVLYRAHSGLAGVHD